jgi:hypothetical protein
LPRYDEQGKNQIASDWEHLLTSMTVAGHEYVAEIRGCPRYWYTTTLPRIPYSIQIDMNFAFSKCVAFQRIEINDASECHRETFGMPFQCETRP